MLREVPHCYGFLDVSKVTLKVKPHFFPLLGSGNLPAFMAKMK
jgi:hypothetical protein